MTLNKAADKQYLKLTLKALTLNTKLLVDVSVFDSIDIKSALIFSPNTENKFATSIKGFPKNKINGFLINLFSNCNFDYFEYFSSFKSEKDKTNIGKDVRMHLNCKKFIIVERRNGVLKSLYNGLRNSIAHGNILHKDGKYYFYSVGSGKQKEKEENKPLTFLLATDDIAVVNMVINSYRSLHEMIANPK